MQKSKVVVLPKQTCYKNLNLEHANTRRRCSEMNACHEQFSET